MRCCATFLSYRQRRRAGPGNTEANHRADRQESKCTPNPDRSSTSIGNLIITNAQCRVERPRFRFQPRCDGSCPSRPSAFSCLAEFFDNLATTRKPSHPPMGFLQVRVVAGDSIEVIAMLKILDETALKPDLPHSLDRGRNRHPNRTACFQDRAVRGARNTLIDENQWYSESEKKDCLCTGQPAAGSQG